MKKVLKFFGIYSVSSKIMGRKSSGCEDSSPAYKNWRKDRKCTGDSLN